MRKTLLAIALIWVISRVNAQNTSYQFNGEQGVFTENLGQVVDEQGQPVPNVLAKASITGLDIYITKTGVTYVLQKYEEDLGAKPHPVYINEKKYKIHYSRVDVALTGATLSHNQMQWADVAGWKSNYYKTVDGKGQLAVAHFKTLTLRNVYPGIDWVWKFNAQNKPEYDFVVHAGADVSAIKMKYSYADLLPDKNKLTISTRVGSLTEGPLQANSNNAKVQVTYLVDAKTKEVGFEAAAYDKTKDLLIDPPLALDWSAEFGGSFLNGLRGVTPDSSGHVYMVGYTTSANFPTHDPYPQYGANIYYDSTYNGQSDAVILKLDTLQHLIYATYMGGPGNDFANSISFYEYNYNGPGLLYVTGGAHTGFPASGFCTGQDAFLAIFDTLMALQYSTFIGGNGTDEGLKVCAGQFGGGVYVAGYTNSTNSSFPSFGPNGFTYRDTVVGYDGFISFYNYHHSPGPIYNNLYPAWSNKFGGSGDDYATSIITVTASQNYGSNATYVAGFTNSTDIVLPHTYQGYEQAANGGGVDGFIAKFSSTVGILTYATYYGGAKNDYIIDAAPGANLSRYFTGRTNSSNFPLKNTGGFGYNQQQLADSSDDAFIVSLDATDSLQWSTYYGGNGVDAGTGITSDMNGQVYVTGFTFSTNFPTHSLPGAFFQAHNTGNADGFLGRFSQHGVMSWSTYKGDSCYQYPADISYDSRFNKFYAVGEGLLACGPPSADSGGVSLPDSGQIHNGVSSIGFCWAFGGENTVAPPCLAVNVTDSVVPCPNQCNGIAVASAFGGTAPYQFYWCTGSTTKVGYSLCPSIYYSTSWVEVEDATGCTAEADFEMTPLYSNGIGSSNVTCVLFELNAYVQGGNTDSAYKYQWSSHPGITLSDTVHVTPGTYYVTVTDGAGCSVTESTYISYNTSYYISAIDITYPDCRDSDGQLAFDHGYYNADSSRYSWTWPNGIVSQGSVLDNVYATPPGTFYIGTDSTECVNGRRYIMHYQVPVQSNLSLLSLQTVNPTNCNSQSADGSLSFQNIYTVLCQVTDSAGHTLGNEQVYYYSNFLYNYLWSTGSTGPGIENLAPGNYSVTVTASDFFGGDPNSTCDTVIYIHLPYPSSDYNVTSNITQAACGGGGRGGVTITGVTGGGGAPYTYLWSTGATTAAISNLAAGAYTATITGGGGCPYIETFVVDSSNTGLSVHAYSTGIACPPGTVNTMIYGGVGPYQYEWSTSPGSFSSDANLSISTNGYYYVTVQDANGCNGTDYIFVGYNNVTLGNDSITILKYPACGTSSGIVTIQTTNPDAISWKLPGGTIEYEDTIFNAPAGDSAIVITDSSNCYMGVPVAVVYSLILYPQIYEMIPFITEPSGCNTLDGSVNLGPFVDDYDISATVNGQQVYTPIWLEQVQRVTPVTYVWSTGYTTSNVDDTIFPFTGSNNYDWWGRDYLSNANPGTYTVTVTNGTCTFVYPVTLTDSNPPLIAHDQITSANCTGSGGGSIHLDSLQNNLPDVYGNTTNTFAWSNGATTASISNLIAGTYTVTITGPNACPVIDTFVVGTSNTGLPVSLSSTGITCAPGTVTATPTGGVGPYQYEWSTAPGNFGDSASIFISDSGKYVVTVEDAHGCSGRDSVEVGYNNLPLGDDTFFVIKYPACGLSNGIISIQTDNPLAISWQLPNGVIEHGDTAFNVWSGDTAIIVTDNSHCFNGEPISIAYYVFIPSQIHDLNPSITQPTGCNTNDGVVYMGPSTTGAFVESINGQSLYPPVEVVNVTPFTYAWSTGYTTTDVDTLYPINYYAYYFGGVFSFEAGTYTVTVTNGTCQILDTITFTPTNPALVAYYQPTSTYCGIENGAIHLDSVLNNLPQYNPWVPNPTDTFVWSNGLTTASINNLATGTYIVTITGPNACPVIDTFQIDSGIPLVVKDSIIPIACFDSSATVIITATGGKFPYTGTGTFIKAPGSYVLTVSDSNGCSSNDSIVVRPSRALSALVVSDSFTVISCYYGQSTLTIYATGGVPPYTGITSYARLAGHFADTVTDSLGCAVIDTGHIPQPSLLQANADVQPILCYGDNAAVTLHASGGTPPYTGTGTFIEPLGNYTLWVTDSAGCQDPVTFAVDSEPSPLEINITVQHTVGCRDTLSALVSASGGTPPYTGPIAAVYTHNGNYTIAVTDHNGCRADSVLAVHLDTCTGIETFTAGTGVLVYPNPAANKFYVKFELPVTTETDLRLYAADGKLVLLKTLSTGADLSELDCSLLASGVYILNTYAGGRQFYFKVVIER